ncbi:PQQ-binding-like beta-propeller repeat protein [Streptomyces sp. NPDC042638]|uniref:protein kinase domain-containing protein n=1 Tax=Streptomyces sp. NPDC042638 TaxID=3154333 RepID=UPI0033D463FC
MQPLRATDPRHIGPYEVTHRLGAGGMGEVYLARSRNGPRLAVKVVRAEHAEDRTFRARFRHEVRAAQTVGGAGTYTARVVDADTGAERPWMATEFVPGPNLRDAVLDHGALPGPAVRILAAALGEALAAIHGKGLVHRDLKPSNILLGPDGPRVIDFGIVRALEATSLTRTGAVVGSVGYVSPEQIRNGGQVGPPSDVFSLGAVLAYASAGREPFGEGQDSVVLLRILTRDFDLSGVPEAVRPLVTACLREDPLQRPEPAQVVADAGFTPDTLRTGIRPGWYGSTARPSPSPDARPSGVEYLAPTPPAAPTSATAPGAPAAPPPSEPPATASDTSASTPAPETPETPASAPASEPPGAAPETSAPPVTAFGAPGAPASVMASDGSASATAREASASSVLAPVPEASGAPGSASGAPGVPASARGPEASVPSASAAAPEVSVSSAVGPDPEASLASGSGTAGEVSARAVSATVSEAAVPSGGPTVDVRRPGPVAPGRRRLLAALAGGAVAVGGVAGGGWALMRGFTTESEGMSGSYRAPDPSDPGVTAVPAAARSAVLRWQYDLGGIGGLDGACCALSPDGSVVYAGTSGGVLHAISRDGSKRWKVRLGDDVSTPVVTRDAVYCVVGLHADDVRRLTAVSLSGSPLWTRTLGDLAYAVPVLLGSDVLVSVGGTDTGGLRRYDSDGGERWTASTPAGPTGTPLVSGGVICTGSYGDTLLALDARDGARKWQVSAGTDVRAVALAGTTLFADAPAVRQGFRIADGRRLWRREADSGAMTAGDRALAVGTESGTVYAVRAADGSRAWTYALAGEPRAVVADGTVYARAADRVWALDLNGRKRWSEPLGQEAGDDQHLPVAQGSRLYVPSGSGIAAVEVGG